MIELVGAHLWLVAHLSSSVFNEPFDERWRWWGACGGLSRCGFMVGPDTCL